MSSFQCVSSVFHNLSTAILAPGELVEAQIPYQFHLSMTFVWEEKVPVPENYGLNV